MTKSDTCQNLHLIKIKLNTNLAIEASKFEYYCISIFLRFEQNEFACYALT